MSPQTTTPLQLFVERLTMRSVLTGEEQQAILALPTQQFKVPRRHDFVHVNEETSHACLIASGMVARFGQLANGTRQTTAFHIPGEMADLHSAVRPIGIGGLNALCDTTILKIPHAAIRSLVARYPAISEAFWRDCMLDAAVLMQWVVNVGRRNASTRIANILCEMAIRFGRNRAGECNYQFAVTQEQLGDAAALTAVHVNRSLKVLKPYATVKNGSVKIHDWNELAAMGEFDPTYLVADTAPDRQTRLLSAA